MSESTVYETQSLGAMLVTQMEQTIARVERVDQKTGKVLGVANCIGRSQARTTMGNRKRAQGVAKAVAAWVASRHPGGAAEETE